MPGPVDATSSTLDVAHEDNVWNNQENILKLSTAKTSKIEVEEASMMGMSMIYNLSKTFFRRTAEKDREREQF